MNEVSVPLWAVAAAAAVAVVLVVLLAVALVTGRRRAARRIVAARESEAELRERLEALEKRMTTPSRRRRPRGGEEPKEYVITSLGEEGAPPAEADQPEVRTLTAPAFADAVFRETMVHSAALVHGVRRALSPEVRYRIRYEMKREVKRQRKDRKTEVREALREYRARHRADVPAGAEQPQPRQTQVVHDLQEESR